MDKIINGDALSVLKTMPSESVHACVTSPPYYGLRDYGVDGQIGAEQTPEELIRPCVLAGSPVGGVVLDPFFDSGTVGAVSVKENRNFIGIEINPEYVDIAHDRLRGVANG